MYLHFRMVHARGSFHSGFAQSTQHTVYLTCGWQFHPNHDYASSLLERSFECKHGNSSNTLSNVPSQRTCPQNQYLLCSTHTLLNYHKFSWSSSPGVISGVDGYSAQNTWIMIREVVVHGFSALALGTLHITPWNLWRCAILRSYGVFDPSNRGLEKMILLPSPPPSPLPLIRVYRYRNCR